jgi:hypothetical protein
MSRIVNIWTELGFRENPFHTDALRATPQDRELYVPRDELEGELGTWLASERRGGIFVEGPVGVGKTSFVNQTQLAVMQEQPDTLPCDDVVEVHDDMELPELVLDVCASILRALQDHRQVAEHELFHEVEQQVRQTRVREWSGGFTVAGTGVHGSRRETTTQPAIVSLQAMQQLLESLQALLLDQGFEKAIVCLNNLDNVGEADLWRLLHDARDTLLQRPGVVLVLIGTPGLRTALASSAVHRRVSEVLAQRTIEVGSLSKTEAWAVLHARTRAYGGNDVPISRRVADLLHEASDGAIRYVLNRTSDVIDHVVRFTGHRGPIGDDIALPALHRLVQRDVDARNLTRRKLEVLQAVVATGQAQPKDFERFGFNSATALHIHLKDLAAADLLERHSNPRDAREAIYRPRGDAVLYFQQGTP